MIGVPPLKTGGYYLLNEVIYQMKIKWLDIVWGSGLIFIVLYQFFYASFSGGYIGAELLLAVVGFSLTASAIDRFYTNQSTGWFSLFARLFGKVFPSMLLMCLLITPLTFFLAPDLLVDALRQLAAFLGGVTNFYELSNSGTYAVQSLPHVYLHSWPLAVTLQLTLVWSIVFRLLAQQSRKQAMKKEPNILRHKVFLASLLLGSASFLAALFGLGVPLSGDWYLSPLAHGTAFFSGTAVAAISGQQFVPQKFAQKVQRVDPHKVLLKIGSGLIVFIFLGFSLSLQSRGVYLLGSLAASSISAWLIYNTQILQQRTVETKAVFQQLAFLSYRFYLYLWPFYCLFSQHAARFIAGSAALLAAILIAYLLNRYLRPAFAAKTMRPPGFPAKKIKLLTVVAVLLLLAASAYALKKQPQMSAVAAQTTAKNLALSQKNAAATNTAAEKLVAQELTAAWQKILDDTESSVDIAVYSKKSNASYTLSNAADTATFPTASIVKVAILADLLHQRASEKTMLSDTEKSYAQQMIQYSDNDAATYLLDTALGGYQATDQLFKDLDMTHSTADASAWGVTQTTAADQLKLLNAVFYDSEYLSAADRSYLQGLMGNVTAEQQWGISAAAEKFQLKNGWLQDTDDSKWIVNSIGHVYQDSDPDGYTIAVLTKGSATMTEGQALIEAIAKAAKEILLR